MSKLFDKDDFPDRPWTGRGYGRIRLDESLARDLDGIMYDEVRRRLDEMHAIRKAGGDEIVAKLSLRRANAIRQRVRNLIKEQGWTDAEPEPDWANDVEAETTT